MDAFTRLGLAAAAAGTFLAASTQALGAGVASNDEIRAQTVFFGDLDLSSAEGAQALYQRIRRAARHICEIDGLQSVERQRRARACYDRVVADAVDQVGEIRLTAVHSSSTARRSRLRG